MNILIKLKQWWEDLRYYTSTKCNDCDNCQICDDGDCHKVYERTKE